MSLNLSNYLPMFPLLIFSFSLFWGWQAVGPEQSSPFFSIMIRCLARFYSKRFLQYGLKAHRISLWAIVCCPSIVIVTPQNGFFSYLKERTMLFWKWFQLWLNIFIDILHVGTNNLNNGHFLFINPISRGAHQNQVDPTRPIRTNLGQSGPTR